MSLSRRLTAAALLSAAIAATIVGPTRATVFARPTAVTRLREYHGTVVYDNYDKTARSWSLYVRDPGAQPRRLRVPAAQAPMDPDIGPGPGGRPQVVYQRCARVAEVRLQHFITVTTTGCDIAMVDAASGRPERRVPSASDPRFDDMAPTIWGDQVAWVRRSTSGSSIRITTLGAPSTSRPKQLPGTPAQECATVKGRRICARTDDRFVNSLELSDRHLAATTSYTCAEPCIGIARSAVIIDGLQSGASERVAMVVSGLAGQYLAEPAFTGHQLAWHYGCAVPEPACRVRTGAYRYDLRRRSTTRAVLPRSVSSLADAGSTWFTASGCGYALAAPPTPISIEPTCRLEEDAASAYQPVRPLMPIDGGLLS